MRSPAFEERVGTRGTFGMPERRFLGGRWVGLSEVKGESGLLGFS